jgi:hypothetical protein
MQEELHSESVLLSSVGKKATKKMVTKSAAQRPKSM